MSDPVRIPPRVPDKPRIPDEASERRLFEIRREGESKGIVKGAGVRPAGAPFPMASMTRSAHASIWLRIAQSCMSAHHRSFDSEAVSIRMNTHWVE